MAFEPVRFDSREARPIDVRAEKGDIIEISDASLTARSASLAKSPTA